MKFLDSDVIVVGNCFRKDRKSKSCLCCKKSLEIVTHGFATYLIMESYANVKVNPFGKKKNIHDFIRHNKSFSIW